MKKVAISACLLGRECRYDATSNYNKELLDLLNGYELIAFCPEDYAFGSPRPTMDLISVNGSIEARSNKTGENLSPAITEYAQNFFETHPNIELYIGKDRSPSCGVCTAKIYDSEKSLLVENGTGLMSQQAVDSGIECWDAKVFLGKIL